MIISKTGVANIELAIKECHCALKNNGFDIQVYSNSIESIAESAKYIKKVSGYWFTN